MATPRFSMQSQCTERPNASTASRGAGQNFFARIADNPAATVASTGGRLIAGCFGPVGFREQDDLGRAFRAALLEPSPRHRIGRNEEAEKVNGRHYNTGDWRKKAAP